MLTQMRKYGVCIHPRRVNALLGESWYQRGCITGREVYLGDSIWCDGLLYLVKRATPSGTDERRRTAACSQPL